MVGPGDWDRAKDNRNYSWDWSVFRTIESERKWRGIKGYGGYFDQGGGKLDPSKQKEEFEWITEGLGRFLGDPHCKAWNTQSDVAAKMFTAEEDIGSRSEGGRQGVPSSVRL